MRNFDLGIRLDKLNRDIFYRKKGTVMKYTAFPDELDTSVVQLVLDAFRGVAVDKAKAGLAALNVEGYAMKQIFGQPVTPIVFQAQSFSHDQMEAELVKLLEAKQSNKMQAAAMDWKAIFAAMLKILPFILPFLSQ